MRLPGHIVTFMVIIIFDLGHSKTVHWFKVHCFSGSMESAALSHQGIIAATEAWLINAVIGLNLCPFAKAVHSKKLIRYRVSEARNSDTLLDDLLRELEYLAEAKPSLVDTTLLIHPWVLTDFLDYNDFLDVADDAIEALDLTGVLQVTSFHPDYQFADTDFNDMSNFSNRSPYPTLHLLREESVEQAAATFPDVASIYENNIKTLRNLGAAGWQQVISKDRKP